MRKASLSISFFLVKARAKEKLVPIYCRITVDRKKSEFSISRSIEAGKWSTQRQRPKRDPELSGYITSIEDGIRKLHSELFSKGKSLSAKELKKLFLSGDGTDTKLLFYFDRFLSELQALPEEYTTSTIKKYRTIQVHLSHFLMESKLEDIRLPDFKFEHVSQFEYYLRSKARLSVNTTTKYLKQLQAVFNRAIRFNIASESPFEKHKFKTQPTQRTFLNEEELHTLESFEFGNESLERVRDVFLFSVYSGLRYTDVRGLKSSDLVKEADGGLWFDLIQDKTGERYRAPLLDKSKEILEKYADERVITGNLLPVVSNQKVNAYLKVIADLCGIEKRLTFHVARHTFATTVTLSKNIPIEVVKEFLGHKDIGTTQIYARITKKYMGDVVEDLNHRLQR